MWRIMFVLFEGNAFLAHSLVLGVVGVLNKEGHFAASAQDSRSKASVVLSHPRGQLFEFLFLTHEVRGDCILNLDVSVGIVPISGAKSLQLPNGLDSLGQTLSMYLNSMAVMLSAQDPGTVLLNSEHIRSWRS